MKRTAWLVWLVVHGAWILSAAASQEPWSFREGRGITLSDKAARAMNISRVSVEARPDLSMDIAVPVSALVETVRGDFVYTRNGQALLRVPVKTGRRADGMIEVVDGLFEGDEVISQGAYDLWLIELQAVNGGRGCADGH